MPKSTAFFYKNLISWYLQNQRNLPWRETKEPYFIWLSEVMLQQTRVDQGLPYYLKFVKSFPTVHDLANASEEKVLKLWQGLGYYSRARNLHHTARYISRELDGIFPNNYEELLKLKGVGDYTASAIASICFDESTAVVDGNVYRVLARVFGMDIPINSSKGIKAFKELAQELIDPQNPGTYNQAVMEFGARYCKPQNPNCEDCIFSTRCEAYRTNRVKKLPVKLKKTKVEKRFFNYLVFLSEDNKTLLKKRTQKGIWQMLYEFPLIETSKNIDVAQLKENEDFKRISKTFGIQSVAMYNKEPIIHKLSHRHLYTRFWIVECIKLRENGVPLSEAQNYAVPVLIGNLISESSLFKA